MKSRVDMKGGKRSYGGGGDHCVPLLDNVPHDVQVFYLSTIHGWVGRKREVVLLLVF